ncbi:MAG: hypothetical protein RR346_08365 [Bacteroidales bacterium]
MKQKFSMYLYQISAMAVLLSAAFYLVEPIYTRYIFAAGAAGMAVARLSQHDTSKNLRINRLMRLQKIAPLFIVGASYFMFKPHNQWIPLLLVAAFIELYTSFMISKEEQKDEIKRSR